jgi:hypothetical protein
VRELAVAITVKGSKYCNVLLLSVQSKVICVVFVKVQSTVKVPVRGCGYCC